MERRGTHYITPGSPWENPYVESFHGKLRDECLDRELFSHLLEAKAILADYQEEYNTFRPHSGLKYKTPAEIFFGQVGRGRSPSPHLAAPQKPTPS